jgi:predicted unusual protein kinase regulating ubiquinone biosynthesis (AarF/ABC1/UbiB family)
MDTHTPRISRVREMGRFLSLLRLFVWTLWVIFRARRRMITAQAHGTSRGYSDSDTLVKVVTAFRDAAVKEDALLIKLGQFLSTRVDLLPERAITILRTLQDEVPPAPFDQIVEVIESELGKPIEEVFSVLERTCTAAASLGQVHRAVLASTGETVAVKIQRPHIEHAVKLDLRALRWVIWGITRLVGPNNVIDLRGFYYEFERTVYEELDYVREAANAKRFQALFKDDPTIGIPLVYDEYVSRRLLVLEWVEGITIDDRAALEASGIDRRELAKCTVNAYFYQFFEIGFFHADPHPANLLVTAGVDGDAPMVTLVDFGMVGSYTQPMRHAMKEAFLAVLSRDAGSLVLALSELGFVGERANPASLERALSRLLDRYSGITLGEVEEEGLASILQDIGHLLYGQPLRIPAQFALTGRAIGLLMGVATELDPEFDLIAVATPYARAFMGLDTRGIEETALQILSQVLGSGRALLGLPVAVERLLAKLEAGELEVKVGAELRGPLGLNRRSGGTGNAAPVPGYTWPIIFAASLIGGIFLLTDTQQFAAAWFCFLLAALGAVRVWVNR